MKIKSAFANSYLYIAATTLAMSPALKAEVTEAEGTISTDRDTVLATSIVNIDWEARYPEVLVERDDSGTLVPNTEVFIEVRVIGAAFGPTNDPFPVRGFVKTSAQSDWTNIFFGNSDTFDAQTVVWSKVLAEGETLDFEFQGAQTRNYDVSDQSSVARWNTAINTTDSSPFAWNLLVLIDGESAPDLAGAFDQADIHAHLSSYFETGTTMLNLGDRDFIYLTELSEFQEGDSRTDLQDLVFLVTYTEVETLKNSGE